MKLCWEQIIFLLWLASSCASASLGNKEAINRNLDHYLFSADGFQSWNDWLSKRGLGGQQWNIGEMPPGLFQKWHDLWQKRGFVSSPEFDNFGMFDKSKLQEWNDWMSKRDLNSATPFPVFSDLGKSQFQQWGDWISKRHLGMGANGFEHGPSITTGLQNWADFVKRQSFMYPSSDLGHSGVNFQDWQDWVKRMGYDKAWALRGYRPNNKDHFKKRQLGISPDRYGSFSRYFTDGLQDWRSSFRAVKRSNDQSENKSGNQ